MPSDVADRIQKAFRRNAIIDDFADHRHQRRPHHSIERCRDLVGVLDAAEDTAWQGPGVIQVVDDLEVVP
jgi:hypothetical protein